MPHPAAPLSRTGAARRELIRVRHYTFVDAARILGISPMDVRLMVEEGRLSSLRRGGTRMIAEDELDRVRETAVEDGGGQPVAPPLRVVLARLEEKAAELAEVRRELDRARSRHAEELRALRREVRELRESARGGSGEHRRSRRQDGKMRRTLGPLFGVEPVDDLGDDGDRLH
jgi:excisionase family DNA binding protein